MTNNRTVNPIPCLSHPVNVLFLDDSQGFLDSLAIELDNQVSMMITTDTHEAKQVLQQGQEDIINRISAQLNDSELDSYSAQFIDIEVGQIKDIIYDASRFQYVPILVVDYQMPEINGVDFCRQLQPSNHLYTIMLTAEADKDTAIQAFNEGIIDHFLMKQSDTLYEDLVAAINQHKQHYFNTLSKPILDTPVGNKLQTILRTPNYIELFNQVLQDSQAVEYYVLDTSGSFLFLDKNAYPYWLIIRTEQDFNQQSAMLDGLEAPKEVKQSIHNKETILFLLAESEFKQPAVEWRQHLLKAHELDEQLWYATAQGRWKQVIDWNKVQPYNH